MSEREYLFAFGGFCVGYLLSGGFVFYGWRQSIKRETEMHRRHPDPPKAQENSKP